MGFFKKLTDAVRATGDSDGKKTLAKELADLKREGRLHARHVVQGNSLITLTLPNGAVGTVRDISYGGLGVLFEPKEAAKVERLTSPITPTFQVLSRHIALSGSAIYFLERSNNCLFVGFQIKHESSESLVAIRQVIEPLRWGESLVPIGPEMRHDRYKSPEWLCLRGDGPTDLVARVASDSGDLVEALLTFRLGSSYCDVSLRNGRLSTGQSRGTDTSGPISTTNQMVASEALDEATLRAAVYIILGTPDSARKHTQQLLDTILTALGHRVV